jgi:hypothetical protein
MLRNDSSALSWPTFKNAALANAASSCRFACFSLGGLRLGRKTFDTASLTGFFLASPPTDSPAPRLFRFAKARSFPSLVCAPIASLAFPSKSSGRHFRPVNSKPYN